MTIRQRCRRDRSFVNEMRICTIHMHNGDEIGLTPRQQILVRALNHLTTPRQQLCLYLYYGRQLSQQDIADELGIDESTVSRTIAKGEKHIFTVELLLTSPAEQVG